MAKAVRAFTRSWALWPLIRRRWAELATGNWHLHITLGLGYIVATARLCRPLPDKSVLAASFRYSGWDLSPATIIPEVTPAPWTRGHGVFAELCREDLRPRDDMRFGIFMGGGMKYARDHWIRLRPTLLYDAGLLSISRFSGGVLGLEFPPSLWGSGFKFDSSGTMLRPSSGRRRVVIGTGRSADVRGRFQKTE